MVFLHWIDHILPNLPRFLFRKERHVPVQVQGADLPMRIVVACYHGYLFRNWL